MLMPFKSNIVNGTTAAAYAKAVIVDTRGFGYQGKLIVQITNVDLAQTMYYKIDGYLADDTAGGQGGVPIAIKAETSLGANTTVVNTDVSQVYAAVVISVKQNSGAGAYQIQFCTY